jgi:hypothetical protein
MYITIKKQVCVSRICIIPLCIIHGRRGSIGSPWSGAQRLPPVFLPSNTKKIRKQNEADASFTAALS